MIQEENKEFYELLNQLIDDQTFDLELTNKTTAKCKQLNTAQLKEFIKTVVDSPLTQAAFFSTATKVFNETVTLPSESTPNIIDRLLFLIEMRIKSISPTMVVNFNGKELVVDFEKVKQKLKETIEQNPNLFGPQELSKDKLTLTFGIPTLKSEIQLNEEIYKNLIIDTNNPDEVRKMLGDAFINEIAKSFRTIKIQDKVFDLTLSTFESRLKAVESLPALVIQNVVEYIENYKRAIDECLTYEEYVIPIDGSLFSIR